MKNWLRTPVDWLIVGLVLGCFFLGYAGHRMVAILLLLLVIILSSWRFYDYNTHDSLGHPGCSGELDPNLDNWADIKVDDPGDDT